MQRGYTEMEELSSKSLKKKKNCVKQKKENKKSCHFECDNFVNAGLTCFDKNSLHGCVYMLKGAVRKILLVSLQQMYFILQHWK